MNRIIWIMSFLLTGGWGLAMASGDATVGKTLYATCAACHGQQGEGNPALNAPALAGQEDWYITRQLHLFKTGLRGTNPQDTFGLQMRPMAMTLSTDQAVADVVAYIQTLPPVQSNRTLDGEPAQGANRYALCATCHGQKAQGKRAYSAPALAQQQDWYLLTQLKLFKAGVRGQPKDTYGLQMQPVAATLPDDQAMKDVIAYIKSLAPSEP